MRSIINCHSFQVSSNNSEQIRQIVGDQIRSAVIEMIYALFEEELSQLCGRRYTRYRDKTYQRAGSDKGSVLARGPKIAS